MKNRGTKIWFIIAALLILAGLIIFASVMTFHGWDFNKLSTGKYEYNSYLISEDFDSIAVKTDTAEIIFKLSDDGKCKVECYEEEKSKHHVTVKENTLDISVTHKKEWYDYISINFSSPKITVYLPELDYTSLSVCGKTGAVKVQDSLKIKDVDISLSTGNVDFPAAFSESVKIKTTTGSISTENISAGGLDLSVTTGKITVKDITCDGDINISVSTGKTDIRDTRCQNMTSNGSTGSISLNNVIVSNKLFIERSTGNVSFDVSDAAEIIVKTNTGDVRGILLTDKVFITKTDTGSINVPDSITGGRCEIKTDTGDIKITVK